MSEILIGQSYYLRFDPKLYQAMQPYPPLGSLYAASYLRAHGYEVAFFDAMLAQSEGEWQKALEREQPRFAVLFEDNFNYLSKMCLLRMRQAAFTMLAAARKMGCVSIVCGADATDHAEAYLREGADFILTGEGEISLVELIDHLSGRSQAPIEAILGLVFNTKDACLKMTARRPDIKALDELPFPAWDLVEISRYREIWLARHGYFSMSLVTTRGCPFHCNWCAKPIWGQRYNSRSPENVMAEIRWLHQQYQPDHLWFMDDILGVKPGWLEHFGELVVQSGIKIPFKSLNRADLLLRGNAIPALKQAGAQEIWIGAESGSQKVLDAMEKGTRVEQIYAATAVLHQVGIKVGFFLQFGYPGEGRPEIEQTLQMVHVCEPDDIGISVSYPLPGTKFYKAVSHQLGWKQNWIDSQDLEMLYQGPFTTRFYRQLHAVVHKEFRLHKGWRELRTAVRHPETIRRKHLRMAAEVSFRLVTLPINRWYLNQLAHLPHQGIRSIQPGMAPEDAAIPSPQAELSISREERD